jgi:hypothetical protein
VVRREGGREGGREREREGDDKVGEFLKNETAAVLGHAPCIDYFLWQVEERGERMFGG